MRCFCYTQALIVEIAQNAVVQPPSPNQQADSAGACSWRLIARPATKWR
jgi:hypothetical protein